MPKDIINKPGALNEREWEIIRTHTVEGQRILDRAGGLMRDIGVIVRSSHERWDGTGHPDGLVGYWIPIQLPGGQGARRLQCDDHRPARSQGDERLGRRVRA